MSESNQVSGETRCKGCNRKIIFGREREGGPLIPLDIVAPVYMSFGDDPMPGGYYPIQRMKGWYVSHFATCPKANQFSKGGKK